MAWSMMERRGRNQPLAEITKGGYNSGMTKREEELIAIQDAYREWLDTNPTFIDEQTATDEDELRLIQMIEARLKKDS